MKFKISFRILLVVMILTPFQVWSQYSEIQGKIVDKETLQAIPYCSISLKNSSIGTCSNNSGEFIFHCPDSLLNRSLIVSSIGYKSMSLRVDSLIANTITNINLTPELYQLSEINIILNQMTASDVVRQVIRKIHKNYPRSPYYLEGFLRDKVYNLYDNKTTRLTEAAVGIEKREFGNEKNAEKVKVLEIRNSYNYSELGSSVKERIRQIFWGYSKINPIYKSLQDNDFTNSSTLRRLLRSDLYRIYISGNTILDGKPIVIIDIKEEYIEFMFQKWPTKNAYHLIRLYIENESSTILKSEAYTIIHIPKDTFTNKETKLLFKQDTIATLAVKQYERFEGQCYLKYAGYLGKIHDQPDTRETEKVLYINETEILVNKLVTNKKEFDKISKRNSLEKDIPLWNMEYTYNTSFWKNYNILLDKPLNSSVKKDLEKETQLDNQFIDAGLKNVKKP